MSNSKKILVIGGTGTVGSEIVRLLKNEGQNVRVTTSKASGGSDTVKLNLLTGEGLDTAFENVEKAFFLSPGGYADQFKILAPLINKAKEMGLKKVVLMTASGVEQNPDAPLRRAEILLEQSGLPYNIIRPSWFMQNFNSFWLHNIQTRGQIRLPVAEGRAGFIDTRDIAAVAAKLLTSGSNSNQALTLTGPELLNHSQVAALLSETAGRKVEFVNITPEEMKQGLLGAGLPGDYTELLLILLSYLKADYSAVLTGSVKEILNREPISFQKYAEDYKEAWKELQPQA